ncbi:MAG: hypothetical protein ACREQF_00465 [Candidatus Binataceae bacterium]
MRTVERVRDSATDTYAFHSAVMKSVTVANAAYTMSLLLASGAPPWLWLPFWIASSLILLVNLMGTLMGTRLISFDPDWRDSAYPLAQTITEFLLYSTLVPVGASLPMLHYWYAVIACHALLTVLIFSSILAKTESAEVGPFMRSVLEHYRSVLRFRCKVVGGIAAFWLVAFALVDWYALPRHPGFENWQAVLGIGAVAMGFAAVRQENRSRKRLLQFVRERSREATQTAVAASASVAK